jgi:hypothetical protein
VDPAALDGAAAADSSRRHEQVVELELVELLLHRRGQVIRRMREETTGQGP